MGKAHLHSGSNFSYFVLKSQYGGWVKQYLKMFECIIINLNKYRLHDHRVLTEQGKKSTVKFYQNTAAISKNLKQDCCFTRIFPDFIFFFIGFYFSSEKFDNLFLMLSQDADFHPGQCRQESQSRWQSQRRHQKQYSGCCTWNVQAYKGLKVDRALLPSLGTLSQWYMTNNYT